MNRTLEAIFRRPLRLALMLLLFPIVGVSIAYFLPRTYESTAMLWAIRRYQIIGSTGTESNLLATPAQTQATALYELLQSRKFVSEVAKATRLPSTIAGEDAQARENAIYEDISSNTIVTPLESNTYSISYQNLNPQIAQQVVKSIIDRFGAQSQNFSVIEAQRLIQLLQSQLPKYQGDATKTAQDVNAYRESRKDVSPADLENDAQYQLLRTQAEGASARLRDIETQIAELNQAISTQGSSGDSLFRILDKPSLPIKPSSLTRQLLIGGGAGLGIALVACAIYLVILVRRDRSVYTIQDLQKITTLPVALQIPQLETPTLALLTSTSSNSQKLLVEGVK